jgi:two-component system, cell cycle sensor histidine kinase and response regulator CckA
MSVSLRILVVEDSEDDLLLLLRELRRGGYDVYSERVETPSTMQEALEQQSWDIVISDYTMPAFNALEALKILQNQALLDIPFIIVSGTIGEETAVAAMKAGAHDYLIKGNLTRLLPAVERELKDAQERKRRHSAEQALALSDDRFKTLCASAPLAIFQCDAQGKTIYMNPLWEQISGYTVEESLGDLWMQAIHPDDSLNVVEAWRRTISHPQNWLSEHRLLTPEGDIHWVRMLVNPMHSPQGQCSGFVGTIENITEKKSLEAQFLRVQRLESLGTLASGIAHDFNNILTPILAGIQMLPVKLPNLDERTLQFRKMIEGSAKRGSGLVQQILSFAQGIEGKTSVIHVESILSEILKIIQETFPKSIKVTYSIFSKDLWSISADATQLHQVLMNLVINARDAMPDGGTLSIAIENHFLDKTFVKTSMEAKIGSYVSISVADTGTGIKSKILDRIFDPFFTTKLIGKGTGLGLSTVQGIIKSHGGFIKVNSQLGKGSEFKIFLPAVKETVAKNTEDLSVRLGNGELILIVDDEISIQNVNQSLLESYNFRTMTASDGLEATTLFKRHQHEVDLVLMDIMMPSMDGISAIRALKEIKPIIKVIAMSGLISHSQLDDPTGLGIEAFLAKPYTTQELLVTINTTLEKV